MSNLLAFLKELIPVLLIAALAFVGYFLFKVSAQVFFNTAIENPSSKIFLVALAVGLIGYFIYVLATRLWNK